MAQVVASTVVDVGWLADAGPDTVVIEVTGDPAHDGGPGTIPGARTIHWQKLLWHDRRREFPSADTLSTRLQALGAGAEHTVVLAGAPTQFAAYALWVATVVGLGDRLRYLDGGIEAWRSGDRTIARAEHVTLPALTPLRSSAGRPSVSIDRDGVLKALGSETTVIVDLRSPEEFSGERVAPASEPIDHGAQRHGRIPGARSLHIAELLDRDGRILPADQVRARVASLAADDAAELVFYCRLSHRAALGWLIFGEILGDRRVRVYDGSWTEWGNVVGAPIES